MLDNFDTQNQADKLADILNWNDQLEDPRYTYEE